ncbi:hypothetical protein J6P92_09600 [bacterium]|nr:hypothetical protein [bacterium]
MGYTVFKKLAQKLSADREKFNSSATNPITVDFDNQKKEFLNKLTHSALNMFEHQSDVKKFTQLVLSDPENKSHNEIVEKLFTQGVIDFDDDVKLMELSDNSRFLRDLGLTEEI